ncbi:MAG: hypothetical protein K2G41_05000 [Duncaniella sp.]|uniref:hypothetical protein n=1 Tax=Duncaniella sp. TaxID=2518496 RepID=UPI0023BCD8E0|nr:hypothetical protein [Duncaniella sp.]MDE6090039.1 hypothetical protein [Duncaniella sp.]
MKISHFFTNESASAGSVTVETTATPMATGSLVIPELSHVSEFPVVSRSSVDPMLSGVMYEDGVADDGKRKESRIKKSKGVNGVSKKFYADLDNRVKGVMMVIDGGNTPYIAVKMAIDNYIFKGVEPERDALILVRIIFLLLKPEIDKAMMRSRKARERAVARRSAKSCGDEASRVYKPENQEAVSDVESDGLADEAVMTAHIKHPDTPHGIEKQGDGNGSYKTDERPQDTQPGCAKEQTTMKQEQKNVEITVPEVDMAGYIIRNMAEDVKGVRQLNRRERRELQRLIRQAKKRALRAERDCA